MRNLAISLAALAAIAALAAAPARADVFHLSGGGALEGEIVRQDDTAVQIRLGGGTVTIGRHLITQIESAPSPRKQYEERLAKLEPTAEAHVELANWCEDKYLTEQAQHHWWGAIALDPDSASARMHLGYVKRGGQWLTRQEARAAREAESQAAARAATNDRNAVVRARKIRDELAQLNSSAMSGWAYSDDFLDARKRVLAVTDPAAVDPLVEVFGGAKDPAKRTLLVEALANIGTDAAATRLVDVLASDSDAAVALKAQQALTTIDSPAAMTQLKLLTKTGNELARTRTAMALGAIGGADAMDSVPNLIRNLITREERIIHHEPTESQRSWISVGTHYAYVSDLEPVIAEAAVAWDPVISYMVSGAVLDVKATMLPWNEYVWVTVRHPSVLDSLRRLTGQDFGWDIRAWQRWYWHDYVPSQAGAKKDNNGL